MAIDRAKLTGDYSLVITRLDRLKGPWGWEIRRKSNPLGIKNYASSRSRVGDFQPISIT